MTPTFLLLFGLFTVAVGFLMTFVDDVLGGMFVIIGAVSLVASTYLWIFNNFWGV